MSTPPHSPSHLSPTGPQAFGVLELSDQSEVVLSYGDNLVGRAPTAKVQLQDAQVANNHALISCSTPRDTPAVADLMSDFGTYLNGHRLSAYDSVSLYHLDTLHFGNVKAIFYNPDQYLNDCV